MSCLTSCSGVLQMKKLNTPLLRTQSSKVFLFKTEVGQIIAMYASPTTRDLKSQIEVVIIMGDGAHCRFFQPLFC